MTYPYSATPDDVTYSEDYAYVDMTKADLIQPQPERSPLVEATQDELNPAHALTYDDQEPAPREPEFDAAATAHTPEQIEAQPDPAVPAGTPAASETPEVPEVPEEQVEDSEEEPEVPEEQVEEDPGPAATEAPEKPAGNASLDAWRAYAKATGYTDEELDGLSRDDVKALFA